MILAINHKESLQIVEWLWLEYGIKGWEEYLLGDKLIDLICESGFVQLEIYLSMLYDDDITLPRDLVFIADPKYTLKTVKS